jgi:hypothetical protein
MLDGQSGGGGGGKVENFIKAYGKVDFYLYFLNF